METSPSSGRVLVAGALLSAWIVALFTGLAAAGLAHVLLVAALFAFPWRQVRLSSGDESPEVSSEDEETTGGLGR